jgi:hypothetical protein
MACNQGHQFLVRFAIDGRRFQSREPRAIGHFVQSAHSGVGFDLYLDRFHAIKIARNGSWRLAKKMPLIPNLHCRNEARVLPAFRVGILHPTLLRRLIEGNRLAPGISCALVQALSYVGCEEVFVVRAVPVVSIFDG